MATKRSRTKAISIVLLLLPSYRCCSYMWLSDLNDDINNKHKKSKGKKKSEKFKRKSVYDLSVRFEGVEDQTRKEVVVMA